MKYIITFCLTLITQMSFSQFSGNKSGQGRMGGQMNIGHFYGKIIDNKTGKGIEGVTIQLKGNKFDTATKKMKEVIISTVITEANGDFNIEGLMLFGKYKFKAVSVGYKTLDKEISFDVKRPEGGMPDATAMQDIMSKADKDLGNIKLELNSEDLAAVTVTTTAKQQFELGIDRKIFNVDKNIVSAGQTATELMKSIPSITVDIDGNVSLRGAAPTIFIDGRPTTLTLDQIPVDIIDKVEIITNPSAKYDASGGNAGILNIVLKKNKKNGYNGNIRAGIDSRAKINTGIDLSLRQNKINFNISANYNQRKSIGDNKTVTNFLNAFDSSATTQDNSQNIGYFMFYRLGLDYFMDNRNTFSFNGSLHKNVYDYDATQTIDSSKSIFHPTNTRWSYINFDMMNYGAQLSYKHLFQETGHSLGADINYNYASPKRYVDIDNITSVSSKIFNQKTDGSVINRYLTVQIDYENQLNDNNKLEAGLRSATRDFTNESLQYFDNIFRTSASVSYKFLDNVYAAYSTYSYKHSKTSFQFGLRLESSNYNGTLYSFNPSQKDTSFTVSYALSLFPSLFITHKLNDKQDIQLNYSRRINRPNFFQLLPSYDFTNPQNPVVGNPNLIPEFTHSLELSYNNAYQKNANFLATVYFKHSNNLITNYIYKDYNRLSGKTSDSLFYSSNINANTSYSYGLELTNKIGITKWWDAMLNFNLYNSHLNAEIPNQTINSELVSFFGKFNNTFKWNKGWSFQINWDFRSKSIQPQGGGGGGMFRGGGGMPGQGPQTLAQGFNLPRWYDVDMSIKKEWTWKNGQSGSINLGWNDVFRSRSQSEAYSNYFYQFADRFRDPQVLRLNFTYKFGRVDMSLFKRKNTKAEGGGMDMMQQ